MSNRRTYSFAHKSLPEFLAARCLWQDITVITARLTPLLRGERGDIGYDSDASTPLAAAALSSLATAHVDALTAATLAVVASQEWALSRLVLGNQPAVISFLIDMLQRNASAAAAENSSSAGGADSGGDNAITLLNVVTAMYAIVRASGHATSAGYGKDTAIYTRIAVASSNCASVLVQAGVPLSGGVLTNALLRGALLSDGVMLDTVLCGADLRDARLERVIADGADLTGADQRGVRFVADVEVSQRQTLTTDGHSAAVGCVTIAPDGRTAASGGADGLVILWDLTASSRPQRCHGHDGGVVDVCFGPDGRRIVSRGSDGTLRLWDAARGKALLTVDVDVVTAAEANMGVTFSPDGSRVVTGSSTGDVVVVTVDTAAQRRLTGHTATVACVAYAPDGKVFASGCVNDVGVDCAVRLWDADALTCLRVVAGCSGAVTAVSFTPDSSAVLTAGPHTAVQRWSVATGGLLRRYDASVGAQARLDDVAATAVCVSPDGRSVIGACVDGAMRLWDADTGTCVAATKAERTSVTDVAVAGDGKTIVSTHGDRSLKVWRMVTGSSIAVRQGHVREVTCARYVSGGAGLATAGKDGTVRLWDLAADAVRVIDAGGQMPVYSVAVSSSGGVLATGGLDGVVRLWDVVTGARSGGDIVHTQAVTGVAFSAVDALVTSCEDGNVRVFRLGGVSPVRSLAHGDRVNSVSCCPVAVRGGVLAASAGNDKRVVVWDTVTGVALHALEGHSDWVTTAEFAADGTRLASGGWDAAIFVWDVDKGTCLAQLHGHTRAVRSLAFAPDSMTLASGSWDKSLRLWDLGSMAQVAVLQDAGDGAPVSAVCFSPDGGSVVTGTTQGVVCVRDCDSDGWRRRKVYAEHRELSLAGCGIRWVAGRRGCVGVNCECVGGV